jgi:glycosyltransferase involved in cell wall biosynthesis
MMARVEDRPAAAASAGTDSRLPLSVAVITLNEETNLKRCLISVRGLASEVVVIDSGSTDGTRQVAEQSGAIFKVQAWQGHVAQKNIALQHCTQPWVLCLDADEAVSDDLAAAIRSLFAGGGPPAAGFFVNRLNFYLGKWIRYAWYPEWRLRLVRRDQARWSGLDPHDKLTVPGATRRLKGDLLHCPFCSLRDHFETELKYARITAESLRRSGEPFCWYRAVFSPWLAFGKILLLKGGWRDGWRGWIIAGAKWFGTFAKYAFLLENRWLPPARDTTQI